MPAAEILSPPEFTKLYAAYFHQFSGGCEAEISDDLELKVVSGPGTGHHVFLNNAYQEYLHAPASRDEILERFVHASIETLSQSNEAIDPDRIVPVIKDRAWLEEIQVSLVERGMRQDRMPEYVHLPYNSELIICFAEDSPLNIRYLTKEAIEGLDLDPDSLLPRSIDNLRRLIEPVEPFGGAILSLSAGGNYETSLILLDEVWETLSRQFEGELLVALPTRNVILVTSTGMGEWVDQMRDLAAAAHRDGSYPISPVLFVRREGRLEVHEG
ncbi:MAG: DUF1444 family protein [Verrucomicrobiales bacterium]|nr:DUF1444 family protein [Verrucomicrobiae bacterium]MCP5553817.1 DUF1444 family protein [Akkermansiaceae bacterium]HRX56493.1 DUF1444 family protein [Verrucomicrobiales bacterium]